MVQHDPVREQIKRVLLARIVDHTYEPGERLLELQIAREMNASQGSVREALRELEAIRLVETKPYRGTRVRGVNAEEMRQAFQVRAVLEALAARLAGPRLKGDVRILQSQVDALRAAAKAGDPDAYARHNLKLHRTIVEFSGNAVLLRVWESLDFEARARIHLARPWLDLRSAAEVHQPIVDAFERGDSKLAAKLLREHAESCQDAAACCSPIPGAPARAGRT